MVTGYHTGIVVNEHTDGDHIMLGSNIHGLDLATANHASRFGGMCVQRNTRHVTVSGRHGFSIQQMNTEQPGAGQTDEYNKWQTLVSDINCRVFIGNQGRWTASPRTAAAASVPAGSAPSHEVLVACVKNRSRGRSSAGQLLVWPDSMLIGGCLDNFDQRGVGERDVLFRHRPGGRGFEGKDDR